MVVNHLNSLTLGTVQLGLAYGLANRTGLPDDTQARAVLDAAWAGGIRWLDTAHAYGLSEARIGTWIRAKGHCPGIVSKLPPMPEGTTDPGSFTRQATSETLAALGSERIAGYLAHRIDDLMRPEVAGELVSLQGEGRIGAFGASVYSPADAERALTVRGVSMLQLPLNLLDCRATTSGILDRCAEGRIKVFARSVFLQGALLLDPDALPPHLLPAAGALRRLRGFARELGRGIAELAMVAVRDTPGVASLVVGMESVEQVEANIALIQAPPLSADERREAFALVGALPETVINPGRWPKA